MRHTLWIFESFTCFLVAGLLATFSARAEMGDGGIESDDFASGRYLRIQNQFKSNGMHDRDALKSFVTELSYFPSQGESSALLQGLLLQELIEDIDQSEYIVSKKCEEDGEEKSVSTLRGVRNAPICINARKLVQDGTNEVEIQGLLMQQHVRHFSIANTNEVGLQSIAAYTSRRIHDLDKMGYFNSSYFFRDVLVNIHPRSSSAPHYIEVYSTHPENINLVIDQVEGACPDELDTGEHISFVPFKAGAKLSLDKSLYFMPRQYGFFDRRRLRAETCRITFSLETTDGKKKVIDSAQAWNAFLVEVKKVDISDMQTPTFKTISR